MSNDNFCGFYLHTKAVGPHYLNGIGLYSKVNFKRDGCRIAYGLHSLCFCCYLCAAESPRTNQTVTLSSLPATILAPLENRPASETKGRLQIGFGRVLEERVSVPHDDSAWQTLPNGRLGWSIQLNVVGAVGLRIHLEELNLPPGSRILVCNPENPNTPLQVIDRASLGEARDIWTDAQFGEQSLIRCELATQADVGNISLTIRELSHIFRLPSLKSLKACGCENDVTCYPEWAQVASGVARMIYVDQGQTYVCTGCLISTTEPSTKDYFLTARHCITSAKVASTIELYWLYQTVSCNGDPPNLADVPHTAGGADLVASGMPSDFAFMRLRQAAPAEAFHISWSTGAPADGDPVAAIHHPSGSYKAISFGNSIGSDSYFWHVQWYSGVTEFGSSGSPLFNANQQLIGQLTGGFNGPGSSCDNPSAPDEYGRFDVTYDSIKRWIGAGFSSNGFSPTKAGFNGLFWVRGDEANPASSGAFKLRTTSKGSFSGQLQLASAKLSFSGSLDPNGVGRVHMTQEASVWEIRFQIEPSTRDTLTGTVNGGDWIADLRADRAIFDGKTTLASQEGKYTLVFSGDSSSSTSPGGDSFGSVKIDRAGRIRVIGCLADGTKFTQTAVISAAGEWPFFASPYAGHGCLIGWLSVATSDAQDIAGQLNWSKTPDANAKFYPGGFVVASQATGSFYASPPKGTPVLSLSNGQISFEGGGLQESFSEQIAIDSRNRVADMGENKLVLTFKTADGTFRGRIMEPQSGSARNFGGVVLQTENTGAGYFSRDGQTGLVTIGH